MNQLATQQKYHPLTGIDLRIRLAADEKLFSELTGQDQRKIIAWVVTMIGIPLPDEMTLMIIFDQLQKHFPKITGEAFKIAFEFNQTQEKPIVSFHLFSWAFVCDVIKQYKQQQDLLIVKHRFEQEPQITAEEIKAKNKAAAEKMIAEVENDYQLWLKDRTFKINHAAIKWHFVRKAGLDILDQKEKEECLEKGRQMLIAESLNQRHDDIKNKSLREMINRISKGVPTSDDMDKVKHYAREYAMYKLFEKRATKNI